MTAASPLAALRDLLESMREHRVNGMWITLYPNEYGLLIDALDRRDEALNIARGALADIACSKDMTLKLAQRKAGRIYKKTEAASDA